MTQIRPVAKVLVKEVMPSLVQYAATSGYDKDGSPLNYKEDVGFYDYPLKDRRGETISKIYLNVDYQDKPLEVKIGDDNPFTGKVYDGNDIYIYKEQPVDKTIVVRRKATPGEINKYTEAFELYVKEKEAKAPVKKKTK